MPTRISLYIYVWFIFLVRSGAVDLEQLSLPKVRTLYPSIQLVTLIHE